MSNPSGDSSRTKRERACRETHRASTAAIKYYQNTSIVRMKCDKFRRDVADSFSRDTRGFGLRISPKRVRKDLQDGYSIMLDAPRPRTGLGWSALAPGGVVLETEADVARHAMQIILQAGGASDAASQCGRCHECGKPRLDSRVVSRCYSMGGGRRSVPAGRSDAIARRVCGWPHCLLPAC